MQIQIPKGTFDILPYGTDEAWRLAHLWQHAESVIRKTASEYGYQEIRTPIYEKTELFDRGAGESSDIVKKEMFTFQDRGGRSISLRPEGTAAVMRSFVENRLANLGSAHKLFYIGPMFRYERPQSGRYRQHHQFGVEAIGSAAPEQDVETIDLLLEVYRRLGIKNLTVMLNSVGDLASRNAFRQALIDFLRPHFASLSSDSQTRFEVNPLRILDSKDPQDKAILEGAPSILDYLTKESKAHFESVCLALDALKIPYQINPRIVRGLDYYQQTVFEVLSEDLGAQSTLGGGGRFDGLIKKFGGPDLPAVGFATGLERVLQVLTAQGVSLPKEEAPFVYFIPMEEGGRLLCLQFATLCRHAHIPSDVELHSLKIQAALQNAVKKEAKFAAILGSEEMKHQTFQLKNLESRASIQIPFDQLASYLKKERKDA